MFTKTQIAQELTSIAVSAVASEAIANTITENTDHTKDEMIVKVPSLLGGVYVAVRLRPYTDYVVARVSRKIQSRKQTETPAVA